MRATTRRDFLVRSGHAALGAALFSPARSLATQLTGDVAWRALITHLEAQIPTLMTELLVPGVSLALIRDGGIAWRGAFGVKDASTKRPVDTETIFEVASMSKPVFACHAPSIENLTESRATAAHFARRRAAPHAGRRRDRGFPGQKARNTRREVDFQSNNGLRSNRTGA